jgi:hypothetical protein
VSLASSAAGGHLRAGKRGTAIVWRVVWGTLVVGGTLGFVTWLGLFLWDRFAILIVVTLTWGLVALGWGVLMTIAEISPGRAGERHKPKSIPAKLLDLFGAGLAICVAVPMLYDTFRNPMLPSHRPGGPWDVELSYDLMIRLFILLPVPYAFLTFVISERLQEWRARKGQIAG